LAVGRVAGLMRLRGGRHHCASDAVDVGALGALVTRRSDPAMMGGSELQAAVLLLLFHGQVVESQHDLAIDSAVRRRRVFSRGRPDRELRCGSAFP